MTQRKYYHAYDDRYRQIHENNLQWSFDDASPVVMDTVSRFGITSESKILEIGCGEGRDARVLLDAGFDLLATDVSSAAISYCANRYPDWKSNFAVLDCITGHLPQKFDMIYAVAVLHMLVEDEDRREFYRFIREHLTPDGIALICTMGDGTMERATDPAVAFDLQERTHDPSGQRVQIAATTCRMVTFEQFDEELEKHVFHVLDKGLATGDPNFPIMMYAVVKGKDK